MKDSIKALKMLRHSFTLDGLYNQNGPKHYSYLPMWLNVHSNN